MRKPMLSHKVIIYCMMAIGFLSYMVWGHHMFLSGMNPFSALVFSFPTLMITIPATIMTLIWLGSLYGSKLRITRCIVVLPGFHLHVRQRRASADSSWRNPRSTSTCTRRISS